MTYVTPDPNLITSGLSGPISKEGITVQVQIVRLDNETLWSLEVANAEGTSTVWDEQFSTDEAAFAEFQRTVSQEGIRNEGILDQGNIIPFRR
jgi:hypothetical protein